MFIIVNFYMIIKKTIICYYFCKHHFYEEIQHNFLYLVQLRIKLFNFEIHLCTIHFTVWKLYLCY